MSADFWAGYASGAVGILIGNPLDVLKVRLQASTTTATTAPATVATTTTASTTRSAFLAGTAAPVLGYGALNALLFVSYNRTAALLGAGGSGVGVSDGGGLLAPESLWIPWLAGAVGGLATWAVSAPTELVKCRAQLAVVVPEYSSSYPSSYKSPTPAASTPTTASAAASSSSLLSSSSSWAITRQILRHQGVRGLYFGGAVTAMRDSIGYGFYFWSYELSGRYFRRWFPASSSLVSDEGDNHDDGGGNRGASSAAQVLLCGGLAGVVTWASVFPLDVIKTRVQTQPIFWAGSDAPSRVQSDEGTAAPTRRRPRGAAETARRAYREGGSRAFFRGLGVCSVRAFFVNAVQWAVYEQLMEELGQPREGT